MGIHDGHRDRMREKLLKNGEESLCDHELIEMLLYHSVPRKDTNPIAHELIEKFGSVSGILNADAEELQAKAVELENAVNQAKADFFADFEAAHKDDIAALEESLIAQKNKLKETATAPAA